MPSGFYNGQIMYADNVSFDGTETGGQITANGQILIGSSVAPNIRVGTLASADSSVTITNGNGTIDLSVSASGSGIQTINGDTGSITGSTVTIFANNATNNSGSTVRFVNSGTVSTLNVTDGFANTLVGLSAGNATLTGIANTGLGANVLRSITTGLQNTAMGQDSALSMTTGTGNVSLGYFSHRNMITGANNVAVGVASMQQANTCVNCIGIGTEALFVATGSDNIGIGFRSGYSMISGTSNVAIGFLSMNSLSSGSGNTILGNQSGQAYTSSESNNILLGNGVSGVVGENQTTRIGSTQTRAFLAGAYNTNVGSTNLPLVIDSTGQIGTQSTTNSSTIIIKSGLIDLKVLGNTILFTPLFDFVVNQINSVGINLSGTIGAPEANFGFTGPNYDDSFDPFTFFPTIQGRIDGSLALVTNQLSIVPAGTPFRINVITADATATTNSQTFHIMGYYI